MWFVTKKTSIQCTFLVEAGVRQHTHATRMDLFQVVQGTPRAGEVRSGLGMACVWACVGLKLAWHDVYAECRCVRSTQKTYLFSAQTEISVSQPTHQLVHNSPGMVCACVCIV